MQTLNAGQIYEKKIQNLLKKRNLLPVDLKHNDAGFYHNNVPFYVEIKNRNAPDFGQKKLEWSRAKGWQWSEKDIITELYDQLGVINHIDKNFEPRKYIVPHDKFKQQEKSYDQKMFEKSGIILASTIYLYEFYARKDCFYIQIENKGFYYLKQDIANLIVPQFIPTLTLRLRAKTHHSYPIYNYSFFAVIQADTSKMLISQYDLEEKVGAFPKISK